MGSKHALSEMSRRKHIYTGEECWCLKESNERRAKRVRPPRPHVKGGQFVQ